MVYVGPASIFLTTHHMVFGVLGGTGFGRLANVKVFFVFSDLSQTCLCWTLPRMDIWINPHSKFVVTGSLFGGSNVCLGPPVVPVALFWGECPF